MITIRESGPQLTDERIASFEGELGVSLPEQYRRFLLKTNGGRFSPPGTYAVDVEGAPGGSADVGDFFGIDDAVESCDLSWNRSTLSERIPDELLPIACDSGGSVFCLSLQGPDRGAVLYCDLQSVAFDYEATPKFYPVASNFEGFLNKICPLSEEEGAPSYTGTVSR
jgi:hypothetical protein